MKALISTIEPVETGYRVAQVEQDNSIFDVAEGLFWVSCPDYVSQDVYWYDPQDQQFKLNPMYIPEAVGVVGEQPAVQGAQTL